MNHLIPIFSTNGQSIMSGYYTKKNLLVSIQTNNSNTKSLIIANGSVAYFRKKMSISFGVVSYLHIIS